MRFLLFFLLALSNLLSAQVPQDYLFENKNYDEEVRTVQLHLRGVPLSFPIVNVESGQNTMILSFDIMGGELRDFMYTIVHCTADWRASDLETNQYIDGFTEDRITEYQTSLNTLSNYVNYSLALPNKNIGWMISGNYLLVVWDEETGETVLTRRFMVSETGWRVESKFVRAAKVEKQDTHHEIDFSVIHAGTRVGTPKTEVKAVIMQNGRWDNAIGLLEPFVALGEKLSYDYQDKVVFPAGKEFRFFDIQQFEYKAMNVQNIERRNNFYEVTLKPERSYSNQVYQYWGDLDGRFSIENKTPPYELVQCDYAKVLFTIKQNLAIDDKDVYVFGELTDWQLKPEFKMQYNEEAQVYYCEPLLKQGYYNYEIVEVDRKTGQIDTESFNGNWYETGNTYTILVYYKPYGERYDRLMVAATFKSRQRD